MSTMSSLMRTSRVGVSTRNTSQHPVLRAANEPAVRQMLRLAHPNMSSPVDARRAGPKVFSAGTIFGSHTIQRRFDARRGESLERFNLKPVPLRIRGPDRHFQCPRSGCRSGCPADRQRAAGLLEPRQRDATFRERGVERLSTPSRARRLPTRGTRVTQASANGE